MKYDAFFLLIGIIKENFYPVNKEVFMKLRMCIAMIFVTMQPLWAMQNALQKSAAQSNTQKTILTSACAFGTAVLVTSLIRWYKIKRDKKLNDAITAAIQSLDETMKKIKEAEEAERQRPFVEKLQGEEALRQAARTRNTNDIHQAMRNGLNIDAHCPKTGTTALIEAVVVGNAEAVELLLSYGANGEKGDFQKKNAVYYADKYGNKAVCEIFERYRAEALFRSYAITNKKALLVEAIYHGVNINAQNQKTGETALMEAMEGENAEIVGILLSHGARTGIRDYSGRSADHYKDVNDEIRSVYNRYEQERIFRNFAQYGAYEVLKAMWNEMQVVDIISDSEFVINAPFDIDAPNPITHETALILAVKNKHQDCVETLLMLGANINILDKLGKRALDWAQELGFDTIAHSIQQKEFKEAVKKHSLEQVKEFIEQGVIEVNETFFDNITRPITIATASGNADIVNYLFAKGAHLDIQNNIDTHLDSSNDEEAENNIRILLLIKRDEQRTEVGKVIKSKLPVQGADSRADVASIVTDYLFC